LAIDVMTGKVKWRRAPKGYGQEGGRSGRVLTTAGDVLFVGDSKRLAAFNPVDGSILWPQVLESGSAIGLRRRCWMGSSMGLWGRGQPYRDCAGGNNYGGPWLLAAAGCEFGWAECGFFDTMGKWTAHVT
jgi:outer membrane protein assembly factor BamB